MTYYATLDWTYPEGARTPLGFEIAVYSPTGSPNSPASKRQQPCNGYIVDGEVVLCDLDTTGTFNDIALTGGYGAGATCSIVVTSVSGTPTITTLTFPAHNGSLYRLGDELGGIVSGRWFYVRVTQLGFRSVYTTDDSSAFKMAVRSVFPDGKSNWEESDTITPV